MASYVGTLLFSPSQVSRTEDFCFDRLGAKVPPPAEGPAVFSSTHDPIVIPYRRFAFGYLSRGAIVYVFLLAPNCIFTFLADFLKPFGLPELLEIKGFLKRLLMLALGSNPS